MRYRDRISIFAEIERDFTGSHVADEPLLAANAADVGVPNGGLSVREARPVVINPGTDVKVSDAIWSELIRRCRNHPDPWHLAALWTMTPGLRAAARRISITTNSHVEDIHAEVVTNFLDTLHTVYPEQPSLGAHLYWTTFRRSWRACHAADAEFPTDDAQTALRSGHLVASASSDSEPTLCPTIDPAADAGTTPGHRAEAARLAGLAERMGLAQHVGRTCTAGTRTRQPHLPRTCSAFRHSAAGSAPNHSAAQDGDA